MVRRTVSGANTDAGRWGIRGFVLLLLLSGGCAVAPYDETTDRSLTDVQRRLDGRVAQLRAAAVENAVAAPAEAGFYEGVEADVHALIVRTESRSAADRSVAVEVAQMRELEGVVGDVRALDRSATTRPIPRPAVEATQTLVDTTVKAILTVELKRK